MSVPALSIQFLARVPFQSHESLCLKPPVSSLFGTGQTQGQVAGFFFFLKPCGSVFFGIACTKIGMRRRLECPLPKDDTQIGEVFLLKNKKQTNLAFSHSFLASSSSPPPAHLPLLAWFALQV